MTAASAVPTNGPRPPAWLLDFRADVHSQCGEDGVIEQALALLPARDRWCVEFGAWDGIHLSNTRNLILNHGYSAALIEGDAKRFRQLHRNYASDARVVPIHGFVGFGASDGLDRVLEGTEVPDDFDFLSIDIDGNDYHVWKAMQRLRPKLVCIEYNPTFHTDVDFAQRPDPRVSQGSSLAALVRLGREKGYELICALPWNALFVREELYKLFQIGDNSPHVLRKDTSLVTYLASGFDGEVILHGSHEMPWHGIKLHASQVQQLPRYLRRYPGGYGYLQRALFKVFRTVRRDRT
jgi:hypothetical protein